MDFLYHIHIMTLFPDVVGDMLCESILGRAQERGIIRVDCHQIRDYTLNKQKQVDNYPYGGGHGAVMQADPLYQCWNHICQEAGERLHTIYLSPAGTVFQQADAKRLQRDYQSLILVCGHYEGIDERFIEECVDEEISLGDFVLTGGEIPLYFSRSIIPYQRNAAKEDWLENHTYYKHIGLYAYRVEVLKEITALPQSSLEIAESLEQLRWLENGYTIKAGITDVETIGIDTPQDLERAEEFLKSHGL